MDHFVKSPCPKCPFRNDVRPFLHPERAEFVFACDSPNIKKDDAGFIVREIHNSRLLSKYAYFKIPQ